MTDGELLQRLRALETELHRLQTRQSKERLEQLLHPDFVEIARNGRRYTRREVMEEFSDSAATLEPVHSDGFEIRELGRGYALVTYRSAHQKSNGELYRHTLRSSAWVQTEGGWQMLLHQGTPADAVPVD